jgi:hypothetical protein
LDDMAAIMTDVLVRPIRFRLQPLFDEDYEAQLVRYGASEAVVRGLVEVSAAKSNGLDHAEPQTPQNTTRTQFPPVVRGNPEACFSELVAVGALQVELSARTRRDSEASSDCCSSNQIVEVMLARKSVDRCSLSFLPA